MNWLCPYSRLCHHSVAQQVCLSWLHSAVYSALIEHARHASFRKVLISPLLSCVVWVMSLGLLLISTHTHTHVPAHTFRHVQSAVLSRPFQLGTALSFIVFVLVVVIVQAVWYASVVQPQLLWLDGGRDCGSAGVAGGAVSGGSEPERPSGVSSLTTGRTPEPLNPGLHSVRSTAPGDSSRGALTAPVFWLDPCHSQSRAVHDDPPNSLLPPPAPIRTINTVQRGCLRVPASSGVYGSPTHSC